MDYGQFIEAVEIFDYVPRPRPPASNEPVNVGQALISGGPKVGTPVSYAGGVWTGTPAPTVTREWVSGNAANGPWSAIATAVPGAARAPVSGDFGKYIAVRESADNGVGPPVVALSNVLGPVAAADTAPAYTVAPVISGSVELGSDLGYVGGSWTGSPSPTVVRQWQRSPSGLSEWVTVSTATPGASYSKTVADEGRFISVLETATNGVGSPVTARSNVIGPIEDVAPPQLPTGFTNLFTTLNFTTQEWWKNNVTATPNTFTETVTATALPHGVEWVDKPRAAGAKAYEIIFDVQSAQYSQFSIEIADGSWSRFSAAIYDMSTRSTIPGSVSGIGGWSTPTTRISDLGGGVYRIQHQFTTDAASTGINIMLRGVVAGVREFPGNGARTAEINNLWWYDTGEVAVPDQPPQFDEVGPFSIAASPLTTDLQIFHAASESPIVWSLVGSPGFEINPQGGGLRATAPLTVGTKPVTVRATNTAGATELAGSVVVTSPSLSKPVISGGTNIGSTLTATNGGYSAGQLYWERDGRIVCPKAAGYQLGEIDIYSTITVGVYDGMRLIDRSAPVVVTQPTGTAWSAREVFEVGVTEQVIVNGTTIPSQGGTAPYYSTEFLKIRAGGGLTTTSNDAMTYGMTYLNVGMSRQDHVMHVTGVQHALRIELRFCVDAGGGWVGESGGTATGYSVYLDRNWALGNPMPAKLRKYGGGGAAGTDIATGANLASGTTEITITTTVTQSGVAVSIQQDAGATINLSAADTSYRGAVVSPAILAGGAGQTAMEIELGQYTLASIPEADRYQLTFEDRFADGDLTRFTDSGAPQAGKHVYRSRYSWDRDQVINGEWQRFTAVEDVGNGSTPRGIQPFSFDRNGGSVITARRATSAEIPQFIWNSGGHYATSPGSNRAVEKWLSGVFTNEFGFNQQYGFFEAMVSCDTGHALWLANWLLSTEKSWPPEFDIPEYDGGRPDKYSLSVHANLSNGNKNSVGQLWAALPSGQISDKQCFQLRWSPGRAEFFINSVPVWSRDGHNIHHRMFWLFCWPVGSDVLDGSWIGQPNEWTPSPAKMRVHYVRTYQRRSWHDAPPVVTARPVLSINGAGVCTITHGTSNAASVVGYLRKNDGGAQPKISGTDNATSYTLTDSDRRNTQGQYGVSLQYVEFHIGAGDSPETPRRREVCSQTYWVTATGSGVTATTSTDFDFSDFFFDVATPPTITTNGGNPISIGMTAGETSVVTLSATGSPAPIWSLSGPDAALLQIGPTTGVVSFRAPAVAGTRSITAVADNGNAPSASVAISIVVAEQSGSGQPPADLVGLSPTLDYVPARDGLTLLQGATLSAYQADAGAHPGRLWMPRFMDGSLNDTAKGTINPQCESFMVDPEYPWSNGWTPFSIDGDGNLRISAQRVTGLGFQAGEVPSDPYTSTPYEWVTGMLSTQASWQQHGGYWEVECRGPTGPGNWWSFWGLNGQVFEKRAEVDVVEIVGAMRGPNEYQSNVIVSETPANTHERHLASTDIAGTFHRYGVMITDQSAQFYRDGITVGTPIDISAMPKMGEPFSLILTNFVGSNASVGEWVGHPDGTTGNPSDLVVKAVRAWQRPGPVSLSLSATTYGEDQPAGATIATLSSTTFNASGITYSKVSDPAGKFTLAGNELKLASAGGGAFSVTLRATDSASRTFTRQFMVNSMPWIPAGSTNLIPSQNLSTASELQNVTSTSDTITETTANDVHGFNWLSMTREAGVVPVVVLAEVESTTVPMFSFEVFDGSWSRSAAAIFDLTNARVHYSTAAGGWSSATAHIMPVAANRWRIRLQFTADASSTGLNTLFRHADATGGRIYAGSTSRSSKVASVGAYVPASGSGDALAVGQELAIGGTEGASIAGLSGGTWGHTVRHYYSKRDAWNCDGSRMVVMNWGGNPGVLWLHGTQFTPQTISAFAFSELRWHATDPNSVYYCVGNQVRLRNIVTGVESTIYTWGGKNSVSFGGGEGNFNDAGTKVVLTGGSGEWPPVVDAMGVLDVTTGTLTPISYGSLYVDCAMLSPSGNYVALNAGPSSSETNHVHVYSASTGAELWSLPNNTISHFDVTIAGGDEVIVGTALQAPDYPKTVSYRLSDGTKTVWGSSGYGSHTSCRNTKSRAAGAMVSMFPSPTSSVLGNQGVLVRPDGYTVAIPDLRHSGVDYSSDYWAQPQACIAPDGNYVVWAERVNSSRIQAKVRRIA